MSKQQIYDQVRLCGVDIDTCDRADAITYICETLAVHGHAASYVVKPYVEFLDRAYRNEGLQDLLNDADMCLADGIALIWAANYLYAGRRTARRFWTTLMQIVLAPGNLNWPIAERASGIDFTWPLLVRASQTGLRTYLVGSPASTTIGQTASHLTKAIPGLNIVGTHEGRGHLASRTGQPAQAWLVELSRDIEAADADIILVGMGFPLQERVCAYLAQHVTHGVFIGEGGTFDYERFGGSLPKAPPWISRLGLEWLWRLARQPLRLRRQLAIPRYIFHIWQSR